MLIRGSCHCGNISFRLSWDPDPGEIPARSCDCTFCVKHGGTWTSNRSSALEVSVREPSLVSRYEFGTRTATFHVCTRCGVTPVVTSEIEGRLHGVVSVKAFDDVAASLVRAMPASFGEEDVESRLARRKRSWIGDVRFVEPS